MSADLPIRDLSEGAIIQAFIDRCPAPPTPHGPGDDAATLDSRSRVIAADLLIEGTHFYRAHPPDLLGHKALAVNLSDIAAMGAQPEGFLLSLAAPPTLPQRYLYALASGMGRYAHQHNVHLIGGDTVRSPGPLVLSLTAFGHVDQPLRRDSAQPGDLLVALGPIGLSHAGLLAWQALPDRDLWGTASPLPDPTPALSAHLAPAPPLWAGPWALRHGASAAMDLSDGLATDLPRLAQASGVQLQVDLSCLAPTPQAARTLAQGGEDYAFIALIPPAQLPNFLTAGFIQLGEAHAQSPLSPSASVLWRFDGAPLDLQPDFRHFS